MSDSLLNLTFEANTEALDTAKEKLRDLGKGLPTVGELIADLGKSFADLPGPIGIAAAALVGIGVAGAELATHAHEAIDALEKLSNQTGISSDKLQVMETAMSITGQSTDNLGQLLNKLNKTIAAAEDPASKSAVALGLLGVSQDEIAKGDTAEIFQHVAESLNIMAPGANKAALEMAIFGKSGAEADTILKGLADNTDRAAQILRDHGEATKQDIEAQKSLNGSLAEAHAVFQGLGLAVLREVTPAIQAVVEWFDKVTVVSGPLVAGVKAAWDIIKLLGKTLFDLVEPIIDFTKAVAVSTFEFVKISAQSTLVKVAMDILGAAFTIVGDVFRAFGVVAFGTFEAIKSFAEVALTAANVLADILTGDVQGAKDEFSKLKGELIDNFEATKKFAQSQLDAARGVKEVKEAVNDLSPIIITATKSAESLAAALKAKQDAEKFADAMKKLNIEVAAQRDIATAAGESLEAFQKKQHELSDESAALALHLEHGSNAYKAFIAARRELEGLKDTTTDEVAGLNAIASLQEKLNVLTSKGTELEKAKALIEKDPGITQAQQQLLLAKAKEVDATKQQQEVDRATEALKRSVTKDTDAQKNALTLSTNALKLYNQEAKLTALADAAIANAKTQQQIDQINAALKQSKKELQDNNKETQAWTQSLAGFDAGAKQAFGTFAEGALNANKLGNELTTKGLDGISTALTEVGTKGSQAFKDLATSMLKTIEEAAAKILIVAGIATAVSAIWGTEAGDAVWTLAGGKPKGFAKGGVFEGGAEVTAFANGGVVDGPQIAPLALFGEAGPEAIVPLKQGANGKLGIQSFGGGGGSGGTVHNHNNFVQVYSNQDPHAVGKQVKQQINQGAKLADSRISRAQRPGGQLNSSRGLAFQH
jgi:lambda family phage tail tape measure protein